MHLWKIKDIQRAHSTRPCTNHYRTHSQENTIKYVDKSAKTKNTPAGVFFV